MNLGFDSTAVWDVQIASWMCLYCCNVILSEFHETQKNEIWVSKKLGAEKIWLSEITFLAAPPPPMSLFPLFAGVTFLKLQPLAFWSSNITVLEAVFTAYFWVKISKGGGHIFWGWVVHEGNYFQNFTVTF